MGVQLWRATAAQVRPATREEIVQCDADLRELLGVMHERSAGGSSKQGRYLKTDTARRRYIKTVALPGLRYGKLPPDADYRILFLGPADWELPANKAEHDAWVKRHGRDPRSKDRVAGLDEKQQTLLLAWAQTQASPPLWTRS